MSRDGALPVEHKRGRSTLYKGEYTPMSELRSEEQVEYAVAVRDEPVDIVPSFAISLDEARRRMSQLQHFVKDLMTEGVDYGVIPGVQKPSLWKPGAEKLINVHGLDLDVREIDCREDWDAGFFYYKYRAELHLASGRVAGVCEGSCNSKEARYRWRNLPDWKATDEDKARAVRAEEKKDKRGRSYIMYTCENDDPYTLVNTIQKMGQKRAIVGATLIATRASDIFTQDVEDYTTDDSGEDPTEKRKQHRQQAPPKAAPKENGNGWDWSHFWGKARGELELTQDEVHQACGVSSMKEYAGSMEEALDACAIFREERDAGLAQ